MPHGPVKSGGSLQTPRNHLEVLVAPNAATLAAMLADTEHAGLDDAPLLDTTVGLLRRRMRNRLCLAEPVILTGHQAEFFHAGVFAKTIAADALAGATGGSAVYLTVDSDTPKTAQFALPAVSGRQIERKLLAIPACEAGLAMEFQPTAPDAVWRTFFDEARSIYPPAEDALLGEFERAWFDHGGEAVAPAAAFMRSHAAAEQAVGLRGTIPLCSSGLAESLEFRAFVAHWLLHAAEFREAYNDAQRAYRKRRRVRAAQRPVPLLAEHDDRIEAPFWITRADKGRRRLYVQRRGDTLAFFADDEHVGDEPCGPLSLHESHRSPWNIERAGWGIRPRALTLSAFCRLLLCDVFIHGIGGAKYDEMTEDFARRVFGVSLPPMACVTATMHLPLPGGGASEADVRRARRACRDVRFNPQRHVPDLPSDLLAERERWVAESRRLRAEGPHNRVARRRAYAALHAANSRMLELGKSTIEGLDRELAALIEDARQEAVALDREYFYALHSREALAQLVDRVRAAAVVADAERCGSV